MTISAALPKRGVYTPVPTFFKKDLHTIDYDSQIEHAKFLQQNGITGLVLLGSTGENSHLTRKERIELVSTIHEELPDFPLMAGVAQNSVEDAIEEILQLKNAGAQHALVLPSSYFGASIKQQGIIDWYTEVADNASLPVLIYVYPGVSNNISIDPRTIKKLSAHPNIVGAKISHGDVSHHAIIGLDQEIAANQFITLTGLGQILLPVLVVGIQGTVDALCGAFPKIYVKLLENYDKGDLRAAAELQLVISRAEELVVKFGVVGIKKAIHFATGIGETYLGRAPLTQDVNDADWKSYNDYLLGIVSVESTL
ncbi:L-KDR aldolase [Scheffersomyces stipitis CBS 6054]|uniref:L-KDR aldolase n=1 Tax=Scheffersomyces stipitis (strain ATCC 58785 / CBS 6054 / NBRC 10063 / NRRL Y-11545) TaxID=322104 RepID=A3LZU9_PICST|nr:L-KDR aldolase [Scheffersomyces stipitis CBS 6054]ABN68603.1 L-KDR aldolase [Scheffersomyces stipitis CBS 6054]KAG2730987.1 hypothetical protein G9P44_006136 [Scheffersomyces stipitis]